MRGLIPGQLRDLVARVAQHPALVVSRSTVAVVRAGAIDVELCLPAHPPPAAGAAKPVATVLSPPDDRRSTGFLPLLVESSVARGGRACSSSDAYRETGASQIIIFCFPAVAVGALDQATLDQDWLVRCLLIGAGSSTLVLLLQRLRLLCCRMTCVQLSIHERLWLLLVALRAPVNFIQSQIHILQHTHQRVVLVLAANVREAGYEIVSVRLALVPDALAQVTPRRALDGPVRADVFRQAFAVALALHLRPHWTLRSRRSRSSGLNLACKPVISLQQRNVPAHFEITE